MTLTTHATHIENNYWSYYHDITTITARTMNVFLRSSTLVVSYSPHQSALTCNCKQSPAECESTLHICDIGMASTLQHGVKRHCLIKAYLWHVCKVPVRRSMVGSSTAHLWAVPLRICGEPKSVATKNTLTGSTVGGAEPSDGRNHFSMRFASQNVPQEDSHEWAPAAYLTL